MEQKNELWGYAARLILTLKKMLYELVMLFFQVESHPDFFSEFPDALYNSPESNIVYITNGCL